jgi:DNA-binding NarL/FixJ family response regulator
VPRSRNARLSSREMEVLQLIAEGKANKETAAELDISVKTVEKHRENLMAKLNIHDTAGLTRYAIGAGIIESSVQLTIV